MITKEVFNQIYQEAHHALVHFHLSDALFLMEALLKETDDAELKRQYESIERDYNAMLDFLSNGGQDPAQSEMHARMIRKAYMLLNDIHISVRIREGKDFIAQSHAKLREVKENEGLAEIPFEVGLCYNMTPEDNVSMEFMTEENANARKHWISGIVLNLWEYFSPEALHILCRFSPREPRAVVGLAMAAIKYKDELKLFPESENELKEAIKNEETRNLICRANREFFMNSKTEQIKEKIRKEIMPILTEGVKDERVRMGFEEMDTENDAFEKLLRQQNANTDKKIEKKKKQFANGIMQLFNMQQEGVDTNMEMFLLAMHNPFFKTLSNWFKPFDVHDKSVEHITYQKGKPVFMLKMIISEGKLTDLDKYALTQIFGSTMAHGGMQSLTSMIEQQAQEAEAVMGSDYPQTTPSAEEELVGNIRALYRLYTKSIWKSQMDNLFNYSFNFLDNEYLALALQEDNSTLNAIAQLMYKYEDSSLAFQYLKKQTNNEGSTPDTLSLMASCLINQGKHRQAITYLQQADILRPDDPYILKLMIDCYENTQNYNELLECLLRLEVIVPTSSKITIDTGLCLMKLGRFQEASQRFYKLEVEEKKVVPSMRAIAWCAFKQQKYETALRYYKKLYNMPGVATWEDYLNGGHTAWLMDDMMSALTFYHNYIKRYLTDDPKITDALAPFDKDNDELLSHGKSQREIDLMHDIIMHKG